MAKDNDRAVNPAAAARKKDKQAALKKSKAQVATQRNEKLARRNPERLQRQIDDLKEVESAQGGKLRPRDKQQLEQLERDVKAIRKARDTVPGGGRQQEDKGSKGERGGDRGRGRGGGRGGSSLGKRRRDAHDADASASEDTDPEVRDIPMPGDTPPPVPPRARRQWQNDNANQEPVQAPRLPQKPEVRAPAQTTYSSEPQIRNLQKEATAKFVPAAVASRLKQRQGLMGRGDGKGRLLEPEDVDKLEKEGYLDAKKASDEAAKEDAHMEMAHGLGDGDLAEEEAAFEKELREAEMEERGAGNVDDAANTARGLMAAEARKDVREAARATVGETEHIAKAEQAGAMPVDAVKDKDARKTQTQMRLVDVEDVSDDEW